MIVGGGRGLLPHVYPSKRQEASGVLEWTANLFVPLPPQAGFLASKGGGDPSCPCACNPCLPDLNQKRPEGVAASSGSAADHVPTDPGGPQDAHSAEKNRRETRRGCFVRQVSSFRVKKVCTPNAGLRACVRRVNLGG